MEGGVGHGVGTRENVSEGNTGDFRRQSGAGHARLGAATGVVSPPRDPRGGDIEGSRRHDGDESGRDDGRERPRRARVPHMDTASLRTADSTHGYLSRNATGGIEGHARGTHPSSSTESMLYMTAAIVYVAVDRARVG